MMPPKSFQCYLILIRSSSQRLRMQLGLNFWLWLMKKTENGKDFWFEFSRNTGLSRLDYVEPSAMYTKEQTHFNSCCMILWNPSRHTTDQQDASLEKNCGTVNNGKQTGGSYFIYVHHESSKVFKEHYR